jgi:signal peptidase I
MILILLIIGILTVSLAVILIAMRLGTRICGIRTTLKVILVPVLAVLVIEDIFWALAKLLDSTGYYWLPILASFVIGFLVWHYLLQKKYPVSRGKALGSFIIGSIIAWIVMFIITFTAIGFVQSYKIIGPAMEPALHNGDTVLVYKQGQKYNAGKIVVYRLEGFQQGRRQVIGRIKAMPGQTVKPPVNFVTADGKVADPHSYLLRSGEYLVSGDNTAVAPQRIVRRQDFVGVIGPTIIKGN